MEDHCFSSSKVRYSTEGRVKEFSEKGWWYSRNLITMEADWSLTSGPVTYCDPGKVINIL